MKLSLNPLNLWENFLLKFIFGQIRSCLEERLVMYPEFRSQILQTLHYFIQKYTSLFDSYFLRFV